MSPEMPMAVSDEQRQPVGAEAASPNSRQRRSLRRELRRRRLREYLEYDCILFKKLAALAGVLLGFLLLACGRRRRAYRLWAAIHRRAYSSLADRVIARRFRAGKPSALAVCREHVEQLSASPATAPFVTNPGRLLGTRALVLKAPGPNEKGVLLIDYTFAFPLFIKAFDILKVAERYHLVLEPSWSGYCDLDILCYSSVACPVFVQAYEPRDFAFVRGLGSNLVPVPTAANWWVDHRVLRPLPGVRKDADVIMVASWAHFKRHHRFLAALAALRTRGERLKGVLVGYPTDFSLDDVYHLAKYFGVADQVELFERLPPAEVNVQLNRSRVNVLWSRREGINRAIIEGMFAGVPCIVREGINYGYRYPYINARTGCFATEKDLPEQLLRMTRNGEQFAPRDWVMQNLSCQQATEVLEGAIRETAVAAGENWTRGLVVKVGYLNAMQYWDEEDRQRFEPDYAFLRSLLRPSGAAVP